MPGHDTSSFVSRDRGLAAIIDGRILRRRTASDDDRPSAAKKVDRFTVAHKKDTSVEPYGEPQTPADLR
jgi:hypothetical protein